MLFISPFNKYQLLSTVFIVWHISTSLEVQTSLTFRSLEAILQAEFVWLEVGDSGDDSGKEMVRCYRRSSPHTKGVDFTLESTGEPMNGFTKIMMQLDFLMSIYSSKVCNINFIIELPVWP